jgi:hypothetical protein
MNEFLQRAYNFLVVNDFQTILEAIRQMNWGNVVKDPIAWLIVAPIVVTLIWKKCIKTMTAMASLVAFIVLLQYTLPPMGDKIPLHDLVIFCGGAFGLVLLNLYLLLVKE